MTQPDPDSRPSNVRRGPWTGALPEKPGETDPPVESPPSGNPPAGLRALRKRVHERFLALLGRDDPPELVAASFAVGVFIAFTPLFGLHALMAIGLAILLRLKKVDVLLGTLVVNPLTIPPVFAVAIPFGRLLLQADEELNADLPWRDLVRSPRVFWRDAGPAIREIFIQWSVGMFALAILAGVVTYIVLLWLLRRRRRQRAAQPS